MGNTGDGTAAAIGGPASGAPMAIAGRGASTAVAGGRTDGAMGATAAGDGARGATEAGTAITARRCWFACI